MVAALASAMAVPVDGVAGLPDNFRLEPRPAAEYGMLHHTGPRPTHAMNHKLPILAAVLVIHLVALWALHTGLLRRAFEVVVPVQLLAAEVDSPKAPITPQRMVPVPLPKPVINPQRPVQPVPPVPVATPDPTPVPTTTATALAPAPVSVAQAPVATMPGAPLGAAAAPGTGPAASPAPAAAPARIELPSSDASYLQNPRPPYPAMSKRLNEQGTVRLNVLIGPDGLAQKAEIRQSSGFERLDKAALETVMKWRYQPGKRDGMPVAMWFVIPLVFALE